ncbi:SDR family oxidoreductase [uncultured Microscilla sp.]|uniref:SDR family oxidoreductase n=1 Tax=uncultured Microscilla sp. TaxID=432653 RepID=UPI002627519F|nr:SDR family oxidoreductase [uncultured Microscilla sp.]
MDKQVALITGSAKGLGKAIATHLVDSGYAVVIHYNRSKTQAKEFQQQITQQGGTAMVLQADVTNPTSVEAMFWQIESTWGRLDLLVNNVGNYIKKNIIDITVNEWLAMFDSNLHSAFYCIHYALPLMQKTVAEHTKHIVNIGYASLGQSTAKPEVTPYYIAKNGLLTLTKSLAGELSKQGVNINMLSPGVLENSDSKPIQEIPKGRVATFDEFTHVLDMLLSPKGHYLTGINIEIAGGWKL